MAIEASWKSRALGAVLTGVLVLTGCALGPDVPPPTDEITAAEQALERAWETGAGQHAPLDLRLAEEKLDEAKALARGDERENYARATYLAQAAALDARLAEARARGLGESRPIAPTRPLPAASSTGGWRS